MIFLTILIISSSNVVIGVDHNDEHAHEGISEHTSSEQCEDSTYDLTVIGGQDEQIRFDSTEYKVPKDTCVKVTFKNFSESTDHDMNIDEIAGENGIKVTHLHQANSTDGPNGDGTISLNILTPNADTELEIYCSVPGHRQAGMIATIIVGEGNPADESFLPGFEFLGLFIAMISVIFIYKRKHN